MAKKNSQLLKRLIAISLAAMMVVGGLPAAAGGFDSGFGIVANAAVSKSGEIDASTLAEGDFIEPETTVTVPNGCQVVFGELIVTGEEENLGEIELPAFEEGSDFVCYKVVSFETEEETTTVVIGATAESPVPEVTDAPTAVEGLAYTGDALALVNEGVAEDGAEMMYALGDDGVTPPADGWSSTVPTGTLMGVYNVWYKAVAGNYASIPVCVPVTIDTDDHLTGVIGNTDTLFTNNNSSATHPFVTTAAKRNTFTSSNKYIDSSESYFETSVTVPEGKVLRVSYTVSCEKSYDYMILKIDGENVKNSGSNNTDHLTPESSGATVSGYEYIEGDGAEHTVWAQYHKDGSGSYGADQGTVTLDLYDIASVPAEVKTAPTASPNLVYNAEAQNLLANLGQGVPGSTMQVVISDEQPGDDAAWSAEIPTATNAGTYKVWYRAVNGSGETSAPGSLNVTISKAEYSPEYTAPEYDRYLLADEEGVALVKTEGAVADESGVFYYAVNDGEYSTEFPTATAVGDYTVKTKIVRTEDTENYNVCQLPDQTVTLKEFFTGTFTLEEGAVIKDVEAQEGNVYLLVDNEDGYTIYSNKTLTPSDPTVVELETAARKSGYDYNGVHYKYKITAYISNVQEQKEYALTHIHDLSVYSYKQSETDKSKAYVKCSTGTGDTEEIFANLTPNTAYYYGMVPSTDNIEIHGDYNEESGSYVCAYGLIVTKGDMFFTYENTTAPLSWDDMTVGETYQVNANISVLNPITNTVSELTLKQSFVYQAKPINLCDIYVDGVNGKLPVQQDEETGEYFVEVPENVLVYNGEVKAPAVTIKNQIDGEDVVLTEEDYTFDPAAVSAVNTGSYSADAETVEGGNYAGTLKVKWSVKKAQNPMNITGNTVVYDGEALDIDLTDGSSDFTVTNSIAEDQDFAVISEALPVENAPEFIASIPLNRVRDRVYQLQIDGTYDLPKTEDTYHNDRDYRCYVNYIYGDATCDEFYHTFVLSNNAKTISYTDKYGVKQTHTAPEGYAWKISCGKWNYTIGLYNVRDRYDLTNVGEQKVKFTISSHNYEDKTIIATANITRRKAAVIVGPLSTTYGTLAGEIPWTIETKGDEVKDTGYVGTAADAAEEFGAGIVTINGYDYEAVQNNNAGEYSYSLTNGNSFSFVQAGQISNSTDRHMPYDGYYNYGYSVQLYTADELPDFSNLTSIGFNATNTDAQDKAFKIYLCDTDVTALTDDYRKSLSYEDLTLVYEATRDNKYRFQGGWNDFAFDTPYEHDTSKNLLVIVENDTGSWSNGYSYFSVYSEANGNTVGINYSEDSRFTGFNSNSSGTPRSYKNVVRFGADEPTWTVTSGNYELTLKTTNRFTVEKKALTAGMFTTEDLIFNGNEQTIEVTAEDYIGEDPDLINLIKAADYTIADDTATDVDDYIAEITATEEGNYSGSVQLAYSVLPTELTGMVIDPESSVYNAADVEAAITVYGLQTAEDDPETEEVDETEYAELELGNDYTLSFYQYDGDENAFAELSEEELTAALRENIRNAGTYYVVATGIGNYSGTLTQTFVVENATMTPANFDLTLVDKVYDGTVKTFPEDFTFTAKDNASDAEKEVAAGYIAAEPTTTISDVQFAYITDDTRAVSLDNNYNVVGSKLLLQGDYNFTGVYNKVPNVVLAYTDDSGFHDNWLNNRISPNGLSKIDVQYYNDYTFSVDSDGTLYVKRTLKNPDSEEVAALGITDRIFTVPLPEGKVWKLREVNYAQVRLEQVDITPEDIEAMDLEFDAEPRDAGRYIVEYTVNAANFNEATLYDMFTIKKRAVTVTADDKEKEFLGEPAELTVQAEEQDGNRGVVAEDADNLNWNELVCLTDSDGEYVEDSYTLDAGTYTIASNEIFFLDNGDNPFYNYDVTVVPGTYTVRPYDLSVADRPVEITLSEQDNMSYTGDVVEISLESVTVDYADEDNSPYVLTAGTDYKLGGYDASIDAGDYEAQIIGKGNFKGRRTQAWSVTPVSNETASVTFDENEDYSFFGEGDDVEEASAVELQYNGKTLDERIVVDHGMADLGGDKEEQPIDGEDEFAEEDDYVAGSVTVKYYDREDNDAELAEAPKDAGSYKVVVTITDSVNGQDTHNVNTKTFTFDEVNINRVEITATPILSTTKYRFYQEAPTITGYDLVGVLEGEEEAVTEALNEYYAVNEGSFMVDEELLVDGRLLLDNYAVTCVPAEFTYEKISMKNVKVSTCKLGVVEDDFVEINDAITSVKYTYKDPETNQNVTYTLVEGEDFRFVGEPSTNKAGTFSVTLAAIAGSDAKFSGYTTAKVTVMDEVDFSDAIKFTQRPTATTINPANSKLYFQTGFDLTIKNGYDVTEYGIIYSNTGNVTDISDLKYEDIDGVEIQVKNKSFTNFLDKGKGVLAVAYARVQNSIGQEMIVYSENIGGRTIVYTACDPVAVVNPSNGAEYVQTGFSEIMLYDSNYSVTESGILYSNSGNINDISQLTLDKVDGVEVIKKDKTRTNLPDIGNGVIAVGYICVKNTSNQTAVFYTDNIGGKYSDLA